MLIGADRVPSAPKPAPVDFACAAVSPDSKEIKERFVEDMEDSFEDMEDSFGF